MLFPLSLLESDLKVDEFLLAADDDEEEDEDDDEDEDEDEEEAAAEPPCKLALVAFWQPSGKPRAWVGLIYPSHPVLR